ncbi:MAG: NYN domain-containing protein [Candidatus Omnitrophica bacterium]|nr:NYN domain-containing protein [Candidatus Omnitrophota bacterium]
MFKPQKPEIMRLAQGNQRFIQQLETLLVGRVNMYIDYANVRPWAVRLNWHIDLKRLKSFLDSLNNISSVKFYYGTLKGDLSSEQMIHQAQRLGYQVRTKPVKIIKLSIDVSSIDPQSPALLRNFIRQTLLNKYDVATIEQLNHKFKEMNQAGTFWLEDRKCNFDVEIGRDMAIDFERNQTDCFVLWSGDSDFHDPIQELLVKGKKVILFATSRTVSSELNALRSQGLIIFDIRKIKDFICWKREIGV